MFDRFWAAAVGWIALCAVEALLVGKIDRQETPVGIVIAALAVVGVLAAASAAGAKYPVPLDAVRSLPGLVWSIVRDTWVVTVVLARSVFAGGRQSDRVERVPVERSPGDRAANTRLALAVAGTSASPNSIVVDVDEDRATLLVHRLT